MTQFCVQVSRKKRTSRYPCSLSPKSPDFFACPLERNPRTYDALIIFQAELEKGIEEGQKRVEELKARLDLLTVEGGNEEGEDTVRLCWNGVVADDGYDVL